VSGTGAFWVTGGPGLPCGARKLGDSVLGPAREGRAWLDVCLLGQHLPQMYRDAEMHALDADGCARLGLCPDCLGFGDTARAVVTDALLAARGIDEVKHPCPGCGGTGRPALRITVTRGQGGVQGDIRPLPHAYVPPVETMDPDLAALFQVPEGMCLACGMPPDGTGPRGEALHT
jgi:hypothetical protein